ncbi:3,4-dihydroxy-2-butanone-4-phosphate synthase [Leuconostoc gelidum]|uniref:3,4-dihydroxy-2-butanone-4-phosphate synthase n=1 Tax=Leuconostoc gelidum TaxID=1244 RepID=UPI001CC42303|nr:3,4-dihydroxy-2-butanone-4-phosphate synthase [Leuconostoc gelidum]
MRCYYCGLSQMTSNNFEKFKTKFTISVDHVDSTTRISVYEKVFINAHSEIIVL